MEELRRLKSVSSVRGKPYMLRLTWQGGGNVTVDMTGVVHRLAAFAPLRDPVAFRKVKVIAEGLGIGWNGGLDYSARSLRLLADEQRTLSGADLIDFERQAGLTTRETAHIFDVAPRTVASYRRSARLPRAIGSMLRSLRSDPAVLAAYYRPLARPRGRPRMSEGPLIQKGR